MANFKACLDRPNPSIAILNLEDTEERSTVFSMGVDDTAAILTNGCTLGFVFRQANEPGLNAKPDLDTGDDLVWIDQQGNLGVCRPPAGYQADINGAVRQYENYIPLNKNTMDNMRPIENGLDMVCGLRPYRFVWKNNVDGKLKEGGSFWSERLKCRAGGQRSMQDGHDGSGERKSGQHGGVGPCSDQSHPRAARHH